MNALQRGAALIALAMTFVLPGSALAVLNLAPDQWWDLNGLKAPDAQWVRAFAIAPNANEIYAGLEGGGVYRSTTGGATWSAFNAGFPNPLTTNVRALMAGAGSVIAGTDSGIWESKNSGAWQPKAQGTEADPAHPTKLNQSVQSLLAPTGTSVMLAGVFSGGVYKSTDGGDTWSPPPANSGMPSSETVYGLTSTVPGSVWATAGSGVYLSTDQGSTWKRMSTGIPGAASPITTWSYTKRPDLVYTSTGSNGIYRSVNGGLSWAEMNDGLGAVRARGFVIFPGDTATHLYAATENGLWDAVQSNSPAPPPARWRKVTETGLGNNTIMWSLTTPEIPGAGGSVGLFAGTQSNGGYFLGFTPPTTQCPNSNGTGVKCPSISPDQLNVAPKVSQELTAAPGQWTGTEVLNYAYQWEKCTSTSASDCTTISGATENTYVVPLNANNTETRYRVKVTVTNPAPTFDTFFRYSPITNKVVDPGAYPGSSQIYPPSLVVDAPGETTSPDVGDTVRIVATHVPTMTTDEFFNPKATSIAYQWLRCRQILNQTVCNEEIDGATARSYTLTPEDGTRNVRLRIRGTNTNGTYDVFSAISYDITSRPAEIGPPLPGRNVGDPPQSQEPKIIGNPWVGETLAADDGGYVDPTTDTLRRWMRCDAGGGSCTYLQKVASTDPEADPTYVVRQDDLGYTLRLEIQADVNHDLQPDGLDSFTPAAQYFMSAPTAVIAYKPVPQSSGDGTGGSGGGGGGDGGAVVDRTAPALSLIKLPPSTIVAGKTVSFGLRTSEAGRVRIVISRSTKGRKVGERCVKKTRKNRRKKPCSYFKRVKTITRTVGRAGNLTLRFATKIGKRKFPKGSYRAAIVVTDAAGNPSTALTFVFRVKRK